MKLQAHRTEGSNAIARHSMQGVVVDGQSYTHSLVVPWQGAVVAWSAQEVQTLTEKDFAQLLEFKPELVIFGSGQRLIFPPAALLRPLLNARIGIETMDTAAACRTYNVLLAEGRCVVAALLFN
jgi:uncharacterized protein